MKKRLLSLILAVAMILSLNVVAFAGPGGGAEAPPVIASIPIDYPIHCPENDQGQDNNRNHDQ